MSSPRQEKGGKKCFQRGQKLCTQQGLLDQGIYRLQIHTQDGLEGSFLKELFCNKSAA